MAFTTYRETRPWAKAIREAVVKRKMPPWFADSCCGKFANDRALAKSEIETLARWAESGAPRGWEADAPPANVWTEGWNIPRPDLVVSPPQAFHVPAKGAVEYQYFIAGARFSEDRWVSAVEVRPGNAAVVHHAVVYVRESGDTWTRGPTKADILAVYAPGTAPDVFPPGMAKFIPAGSELVLEIHYTPVGKAGDDRTRIGMVFAKAPPAKRVLTLQMNQTEFRIPAGQRDYRVSVWGTLPNDALLLGFFPHMHLRGKSFEFTRILENSLPETLLLLKAYDFYWQLWYRLAAPMPLKKGTRLNWIATYDNSAANPRNPDPTADVGYGFQSWEEMMVGFFDVAVDAGVDKKAFFVRQE
ncbi:MAG: thiol-disulfide isomerase [Bryobacterales bacterium]|nr:thiol-disulfide isomerase [Bryobacterales bacterium]